MSTNINKEQHSRVNGESALCFVDSVGHARKLIAIQQQFSMNIECISNNKTAIKLLKNHGIASDYFLNLFSLVIILFRRRNRKFKYMMAACIDQDAFHFIYFFSKFENLLTFDEGYFTIKSTSRFNIESQFPFKTQKRNKILNMFFGFPKPPKLYIENALHHFGWFQRDLYKNSAVDDKKIIFMEHLEPNILNDSYKIFIGQPFKWMGLSRKNYQEIIEFIRLHEIDLYICHPRETAKNSILDKIYLPTATFNHDAESFINKLGDVKELEVFSFMSTLCFNLNSSIKVNIIDLNLSKQMQIEFDIFVDALKKSRLRDSS